MLSNKLLTFFHENKNDILKDKARALKLINCFNKSKESLRPIGECLTDYFIEKVENLGLWALEQKKASGFRQFLDGSCLCLKLFMTLMRQLLQYWAEEQFFQICLEKLLFKTILVWNAFFKEIDQIRNFVECKFT
jgi:Tat protein secretion system quality control protein TatD with DNase activity